MYEIYFYKNKNGKEPIEEIMDTNIGRTWKEVRKEIFTPKEILESDLRVALISEIIKARQEQGITQEELEKLTEVKQPIIAKMEEGTIPDIDTLIKILIPLGKTLAIVPLETE